jgi:hypothetical protein
MREGASFDGGRMNGSSIELPRAILPFARTIWWEPGGGTGCASVLGQFLGEGLSERKG